ncbi:hypothetical protein [Fodinicola feengrottensis]|uniref:SMP-30/Gluconolactonase/LRE-like region domain-containing protein n=1 Tax=Fodinicola feengrottensis TaxID=435914 RepID=A0ABN2GH90_9ACTN|nr:hypothetical protein [Fodinicola feengrottensis]
MLLRMAAALAALTLAVPLPFGAPHILTHLDLAAGQQPENIAVESPSAVDVTFGFAGKVARIDRSGAVRVLATVPVPPNGDVPGSHTKIFTGGIVIDRGVRYFAVSTGLAADTGIYRFRVGQPAVRMTALPSSGFYNGMALDAVGRRLLVADSAHGTMWQVPLSGRAPSIWSASPLLAPKAGFGANGVKIHGNSVWVSNLDAGTLVRLPFVGVPRVVVSGLGPVDDFAFTPDGRFVIAAINQENRVVQVDPYGSGQVTTLWTAANGLSNPTAVAFSGESVLVTDAAYFTQQDPNILTARWG